MLQCKSCPDWFHGECVPYTCPQCTEKQQKKVEERHQKTTDQVTSLKKDLEVSKLTLSLNKNDIKGRDDTIKSLEQKLKKLEKIEEAKKKKKQINDNVEIKVLNKQVKELEEYKQKMEKEKVSREKEVQELRKEVQLRTEEINLSAIRNRELREECAELKREQNQATPSVEITNAEPQTAAAQHNPLCHDSSNGELEGLRIKVQHLTETLQKKDGEITELKKTHKKAVENKENELKNLKSQITAYEERLETALCTAGLREKEKMHIVENHDNLKRMYTNLLSLAEEKEDDDMEISKPGRDHTKQKSGVQKKTTEKEEKIKAICKFGEECRHGLDCKFGHPERSNPAQNKLDLSHGGEDAAKRNGNDGNPNKEKKASKKGGVSTTRCRNGPTCKYLKTGYCMFSHPEINDDKPRNKLKDKQDKKSKKNLHTAVPCRNGQSCKYYLNRNCNFGHPEEKGDWKNGQDKSRSESNNILPLYSAKAKGNEQVRQEQTEQKNMMEGMQKNMHSLKMTMTNMMAEITRLRNQMKSKH